MSIVARKRGGKTYLYFQAGRKDDIYLGPETDGKKLKPDNILKAIAYLDEKLDHYEQVRSQLISYLPENYRSTLTKTQKSTRRPGGRTPKVAIKPDRHLSEIEENLGIEYLHDRIKKILHDISRHPSLKEQSQEAVTAASILVAAREKGIALLMGDVEKQFPGIKHADMDYCYRIAADATNLEFRVENVSNFVQGIGQKALMDSNAISKAKALIEEAFEYGFTSRRNFGLAAAALYIAGCEALKGKYNDNKLYDLGQRLAEAADEGINVVMESAENMAEFIKENRKSHERTDKDETKRLGTTKPGPSTEKSIL